ncbi:MAG: DUF3108 domain-containing protein [Thermodesulfobacteriota bacterium]
MSARMLVFLIFVQILLMPGPAVAANGSDTREELRYQVSLGPWDDVARVHLVLKELEPGRYLAEFSGAAQGMWKLLSRWLPERYQTEMIYRDGRLKPLVYQEKFIDKGRHVTKEYRFDYENNRLTLWQQTGGDDKVRKWETPLTEPVYDLLSLFYNVRIGTLGTLQGGSSLRVAVLSSKPQEMIFRIADKTSQGLKVMLNFRPPDSTTEDHYFIFLNHQGVPTLAWTRVTLFGKLAGRLLNPGEIRENWLPSPSPAASPVLGAR